MMAGVDLTLHPETAERFLTMLFAGMDLAPDDAPRWFHLWTLEGQQSTWMRADQLDASVLADLMSTIKNLYFSAGLYKEPLGSSKRGGQMEVWGIPAFSIDVDVFDPQAHAKTNLPPTIEDALAMVTEFELPPTAIIISAHGLQLWFGLREIAFFDSRDERARYIKLSAALQASFRWLASSHGWTIDSTYDLCRLMRLPGGINAKHEPFLPVTVLSSDGPRYNFSEIEEAVYVGAGVGPTPENGQQWAYEGPDGPITLNPDALAPADKLEVLLTLAGSTGRRFVKTWTRQRTDFPQDDYSASAYDMALANIFARAGWTDQEIIDGCIHWRRKHSELNPKKIARMDYWFGSATRKGLIQKARAGRERYVEEDEIETTPEEVAANERSARAAETATLEAEKARRSREKFEAAQERAERASAEAAFERAGDNEEEKSTQKQRLLASVSRELGVRIERVIQYMSDPIEYRLVIGGKEIIVGNAAKFQEQKAVRSAVMDAIQDVPLAISPQEWYGITRSLVRATDRVEAPPEVTHRGRAQAWLTDFLSSNQPVDNFEDAQDLLRPYEDDEANLHVFSGPFFSWATGQPERPTSKIIVDALKEWGCTRKTVHVRQGNDRTSRSVWILPFNPLKTQDADG